MQSSVRALTATLVTALVLLAGCLGEDAPSAGDGAGRTSRGVLSSNLDAVVPADAHAFEGSVAREEAGYGVTEFTLPVPEGAVGVHALGEWAPRAPLELRLVSPEGEVVKGVAEVAGVARAVTAASPSPTPGDWTLRVVTPAQDADAFTVRAWAVMNVTEARVDERVALGPGEWLEMNVVLDAGATLQWAFEGEGDVAFDVHSHNAAGGVVTHAQGRSNAQSGAFTAPERNVYSFFAEGADGAPLTFSYAVKGPFRVSSRILG